MTYKGQELATANREWWRGERPVPGIKKDDAFSRLMADVVKDTAVMYSTYTIEQATQSPVAAASVAAASVTPASANAAAATPIPPTDSQALAIGRPADTTRRPAMSSVTPPPCLLSGLPVIPLP